MQLLGNPDVASQDWLFPGNTPGGPRDPQCLTRQLWTLGTSISALRLQEPVSGMTWQTWRLWVSRERGPAAQRRLKWCKHVLHIVGEVFS